MEKMKNPIIKYSSFWESSPINVDNSSNESNQILSKDKLIEQVEKTIRSCKYKLDYKLNDPVNTPEIICDFINKYYVVSEDSQYGLVYTPDILKYYMENALTICFYSTLKNNNITDNKIIGVIIGKKESIMVGRKLLDCVEVNFLSLHKNIRNLNLAPLMISILTREVVKNYSICIAHYTICQKIKCDHYCLKYQYHRMINIDKLFEYKFIRDENPLNIDLYKEKYLEFIYGIKNLNIVYYNSKISDKKLSDDLINFLYQNTLNYNKLENYIWEHKTFEQFAMLFKQNFFHHFFFIDESGTELKFRNYMCVYELDNKNFNNNITYTNGYIYLGFYQDNIGELIEYLSCYSYKNKLFDMITWTDFFKIDYPNLKAIRGDTPLKYYLFNSNISRIPSLFNGMVTI